MSKNQLRLKNGDFQPEAYQRSKISESASHHFEGRDSHDLLRQQSENQYSKSINEDFPAFWRVFIKIQIFKKLKSEFVPT